MIGIIENYLICGTDHRNPRGTQSALPIVANWCKSELCARLMLLAAQWLLVDRLRSAEAV